MIPVSSVVEGFCRFITKLRPKEERRSQLRLDSRTISDSIRVHPRESAEAKLAASSGFGSAGAQPSGLSAWLIR